MAAQRPSNTDAVDQQMMQRALQLARNGQGWVEPNPMVGCVIRRGEQIIGEGYHRRFGGPHAEVEALSACKTSPRDATVYVTLEPCAHFGKTPPCADAILGAGIRRVVAAVRDPNPAVDGAGFARLRAAPVVVDDGVEAEAAMELVAPFATRMREGRPYVIAKWAQTSDGSLTTSPNEDRWISGEESRHFVHELRARVDAVVVGVNTVIHDDPLLTGRNVAVKRPCARVVLDSRLRIPLGCKLANTARDQPTIVFTSPEAATLGTAQRLQRLGVEVIALPTTRSRVDLHACLKALDSRSMTNVVVEGGRTVLGSFFREGLIDEAYAFVAPRRSSNGEGRDDERPNPDGIETGSRPISQQVFRTGIDTCFHMRFTDPRRLWIR
jgi:diaminohydroxyphosphoribosylaminopyrimidine deaminase/5-amino-6-(5-phosphoribosylamino)uracil reductase